MAEPPSRNWVAWASGAIGLLATLGSGLYGAAEWVTRISQAARHNAEAIAELGKRIDGLNTTLAATNERVHQTDTEFDDKFLDMQRQLTDMQRAYHNVLTLEERYDHAFATHQPQPSPKRHRR